jgi:hypothetical protein
MRSCYRLPVWDAMKRDGVEVERARYVRISPSSVPASAIEAIERHAKHNRESWPVT